jgi:F-type H+-transporting ATPase subunit epsilon
MSTITLEIISQEKHLATMEVDQVTVPTTTGEVTILPNHIPMFTKMVDGVVITKIGDKTEDFAVLGGFMDVGPDSNVTILADAAVKADDINTAKAEEAKRIAEQTMKNKSSEIEFKEAEASLRKAMLELRVASTRRRQNRELPQL